MEKKAPLTGCTDPAARFQRSRRDAHTHSVSSCVANTRRRVFTSFPAFESPVPGGESGQSPGLLGSRFKIKHRGSAEEEEVVVHEATSERRRDRLTPLDGTLQRNTTDSFYYFIF